MARGPAGAALANDVQPEVHLKKENAMNAQRLLPILWVSVLLMSACAPGGVAPTSTPAPTSTAAPTETLAPTSTPTASPTPIPIPGIDIPVYAGGVKVVFTCKDVIDGPFKPFTTRPTYTPPTGTSLLVRGTFTGDMLDWAFDVYSYRYLVDGSGISRQWSYITAPDATTFQMIFPVKKGSKGFIFHNDQDTHWSVDLTSLSPCSK